MISEFIYAVDWATHKVAVCGHQNPDIKEIEIPETIEVNGEQMPVAVVNLSENKKLEKVVIPATVEAIAGEGFAGLKKLKTLVIQGKGCSIGLDAFKDCKKLSEVTIPTVCLQYLKAFEGTPYYESAKEELASESQKPSTTEVTEVIENNVLQVVTNAVDYSVPEGVTYIKEGAFEGSPNLRSVVLPESIENIDRAFKDCKNLEKVTLPQQVKEGMTLDGTFIGCTSLNELELPEGIVSIINLCCGDASLERVHLPSTLQMEKLEDSGGFCGKSKCNFEGCDNLVEINIPKGIKSLERALQNKEKLQRVTLEDGIEDIRNAFGGCSSLKEIVLPHSITSMGSSFSGCSSLKKIDIPLHVTDLSYAFQGCTSLKTVVIPEGVENINHAFQNCSSLENVKIADTVTFMDESFKNCTHLKAITIPKSVICASEAFEGCTALETIQEEGDGLSGMSIKGTPYYEKHLETVEGAIYYKNQLMKAPEDAVEFSLREGTRVITSEAFKGCDKLTKLDLPASVTTIEKQYRMSSNSISECKGLKEIIIRGFAINDVIYIDGGDKDNRIFKILPLDGPKALTKVICLSNCPIAFSTKAVTTIYVPEESIEGYKKIISETSEAYHYACRGKYKAIKPLSAIRGGNFVPFTPSTEK